MQTRDCASLSVRPCATSAEQSKLARPIPAEPAPRKRYFSSFSFVPLSLAALIIPARVIPAVPFEYEMRVLRKGGQYRWHLIQYNPLKDEQGQIVRWYVTATDIDDMKRAVEELRRSEGYLAEAQRLTSTGSWAWNVAISHRVYWSQENYRMFG